MRHVAARLGTGPASLYAHVSGKDDLLELVLDRVIAEVQVPTPDPARWQDQVKEILRSMRDAMRAHRGIAAVNLGIVALGAEAMRVAEGMLAIMRSADVPAPVAGLAVDLLAQFAVVTIYEEDRWMERLGDGADVDAFVESMRNYFNYFADLPVDRFPNLVAMADDVTADDGEDLRFEFGLDVLLAGLTAKRRIA